MATHTWNKLVRDRVPEIIAAGGARPVTRTLTDAEYDGALRQKIVEEGHEALCASDRASLATELADILEVVCALATVTGIPADDLDALRRDRAAARGAFEKRVFLIETREGAETKGAEELR